MSRLAAQAAPLAGQQEPLALKCTILPSQQFEHALRSSALRQSDQARLTGEETAFKLLGFIPSSFDYTACFSGSSIEGINSFYDIRSRSVVLRQGASLPETALLAEGLVALRDRMFGLSRITARAKTTDSTLAANALIQGDLTALLKEAAEKNIARENLQPAKETASPTCIWPEPLKDLLFFPLDWGPLFASSMRQSADQDRISRAFLEPPRSSHDIIHAARFLEAGPFTTVSRAELQKPAHPVSGQPVFRDSLGQFALQALLKHYSNAATGIKAAKGWRGDVLEVFRLPGTPSRHAARWLIAFESQQDLLELGAALRAYSQSRYDLQISPEVTTGWKSISAEGLEFSFISRPSPFPLAELVFQ